MRRKIGKCENFHLLVGVFRKGAFCELKMVKEIELSSDLFQLCKQINAELQN